MKKDSKEREEKYDRPRKSPNVSATHFPFQEFPLPYLIIFTPLFW
jgi:hypothetical protein